MGNDAQDTNRVIVGKSYHEANQINYKEVTERLVKLERTLTGSADSYNVPPLPPIGAIIAWVKSLTGTPQTLPANWVECNGQTLSDAGSPLNGVVIPNLNGEARFLRGAATSGTSQADAMQGHYHNITFDTTPGASLPANATPGGAFAGFACATGGKVVDISVGAPRDDGTNGTPRVATETRPVNYSVVWIMRVK